MTDEELMAKVQAGDSDAFETLVTRHYDEALRYAGGFLKDSHLCRDAVQDSFASLYHKRHQYDTRLSFSVYLRALVRHKCIDLLRRQKRTPAEQFGVLPDCPDTETPESRLVNKLFKHSLLSLIENMPKEHRALLVAYALDGKSYKELAAQFSKTVPQIKITLHRIRKQLKSFKEEWS